MERRPRGGDMPKSVLERVGGGNPGGADRPGGTVGTLDNPDGNACGTSGDNEVVASGGLEPISDSNATDDVGDLGMTEGTGGAGSFCFVGRIVGRFEESAGVPGRDVVFAVVLGAPLRSLPAARSSTTVAGVAV